MNKYLAIIVLSVTLIGFSAFTSTAKAANFFVVPPELMLGQEAEVVLAVNSESQSINTVDLKLSFSKGDFLIKKINEAGSLISFWVDNPSFSNDSGEISLSGIIPGGYQGKDGELLKINLVPLKLDKIGFTINQAQVLLNDGNGTEAKLTPSVLNFQVVGINSPNQPPPISEIKDTEPPELFTPEIGRQQDIFNNQWFLAFTTQDKNSGISHYEIREIRYKILAPYVKWQTAQSPYILEDQQLKSFIYVKVTDLAGNSRIVILPPTHPLKWYENYIIWGILILIVVVAAVLSFLLRRYRNRV